MHGDQDTADDLVRVLHMSGLKLHRLRSLPLSTTLYGNAVCLLLWPAIEPGNQETIMAEQSKSSDKGKDDKSSQHTSQKKDEGKSGSSNDKKNDKTGGSSGGDKNR